MYNAKYGSNWEAKFASAMVRMGYIDFLTGKLVLTKFLSTYTITASYGTEKNNRLHHHWLTTLRDYTFNWFEMDVREEGVQT
ncbi:hypothetical protein ACSBR2_021437 [Camellia fascicularis]